MKRNMIKKYTYGKSGIGLFDIAYFGRHMEEVALHSQFSFLYKVLSVTKRKWSRML